MLGLLKSDNIQFAIHASERSVFATLYQMSLYGRKAIQGCSTLCRTLNLDSVTLLFLMPIPIFVFELFFAHFAAKECLIECVHCKSAHLDAVKRLLAVWTFFVFLQPHFEAVATSQTFALFTLLFWLVHHHEADVAVEEFIHWSDCVVGIQPTLF